ncbi:uncharacterized protein MYCFIDRAFT_179120 [Pseudocercospora fijiensis CIRAD86]|uniref:Uncharacterized protein n=1 Tax=Pseudocercospora fijiensis (strain CIRAD86) TaxID=383855 RepID=M2YIK9_PSEFD|nr:uncharacterized protein MYCFIDRAFT_179120 [Pseudocercospora fijiensis CIRAD86]EME77605.1 hypothetical protein MYCFIDRAFT_179120 [Pseudocercospora fijiensis CIRAD86]
MKRLEKIIRDWSRSLFGSYASKVGRSYCCEGEEEKLPLVVIFCLGTCGQEEEVLLCSRRLESVPSATYRPPLEVYAGAVYHRGGFPECWLARWCVLNVLRKLQEWMDVAKSHYGIHIDRCQENVQVVVILSFESKAIGSVRRVLEYDSGKKCSCSSIKLFATPNPRLLVVFQKYVNESCYSEPCTPRRSLIGAQRFWRSTVDRRMNQRALNVSPRTARVRKSSPRSPEDEVMRTVAESTGVDSAKRSRFLMSNRPPSFEDENHEMLNNCPAHVSIENGAYTIEVGCGSRSFLSGEERLLIPYVHMWRHTRSEQEFAARIANHEGTGMVMLDTMAQAPGPGEREIWKITPCTRKFWSVQCIVWTPRVIWPGTADN